MQLSRARLGDDVDGAAARLRELRGRERGLGVEFLHRFHGRIDGDGERVAVGVVGAVEEEGVLGGARAVDGRIECDGAASPLLDVVVDVVDEAAELARDSAGSERDQRDDVAGRQRKLVDFGLVHAIADGGAIGIDRGDGSRDGDAVAAGSESQANVLPGFLVDFEGDAAGLVGVKSFLLDGESVGAGRRPDRRHSRRGSR